MYLQNNNQQQVETNLFPGPINRLNEESPALSRREIERVVSERRSLFLDRYESRNRGEQILTDDSSSTESTTNLNATSVTEEIITQNTPIFNAYPSFFRGDRYNRPTILNVQPERTVEDFVDETRIPETQQVPTEVPGISHSTITNTYGLRFNIRENIERLRTPNTVERENLEAYRQQVLAVSNALDIPYILAVNEWQRGLYMVLNLLSSPVLAYILLNLEITGPIGGALSGIYVFMSGVLSLLRPYLFTAVDVRMWASVTLGGLRHTIVSHIHLLNFQRNRVTSSANTTLNIRNVLNNVNNSFINHINRIRQDMQSDIQRIRSNQIWRNRYFQSALLGGVVTVSGVIISNPQAFWSVALFGVRTLLRLPRNVGSFISHPFLPIESNNARDIGESSNSLGEMRRETFERWLHEIVQYLMTVFYN